jgi:glycosyltransferase involved in cell wall biosynthesis
VNSVPESVLASATDRPRSDSIPESVLASATNRLRSDSVHVVLPGDVDDRSRPSGGNHYDRRVCDELGKLGWTVHELPMPGAWPRPSTADRDALAKALADVPDGEVVLLDGLVASAAPDEVTAVADRLLLVVIVHMLLGTEFADLDAHEHRTVHAAAALIVTSEWAKRRLVEHHGVSPERVSVVSPGADPAPLRQGSDEGDRLLCVAAVTPVKGYDVLVEALRRIAELSWTCRCVGSMEREPEFAAAVRDHGLGARLSFVGPLDGADLADAYAEADLLVMPSRSETYGMVITEALARGVPVVASDVHGVPEAVGATSGGFVPGILVPPGDPVALSEALRRWLTDPRLRYELSCDAADRRRSLTDWRHTAGHLSAVLR